MNISRVKSFELHPEFASTTLVANIALVELADSIAMKQKPKLPAQGEKVTDTAKLVGFMTTSARAYPDQLSMQLTTDKSIPIKSLATCRSQFASNVVQEGMLCAGFEFQQAGLCYVSNRMPTQFVGTNKSISKGRRWFGTGSGDQ